MKKLTQVQRLLFINLAILSSISISLTGFEQIHWFAYVVPGALLFAALSGYCIGLDISRILLKALGITQK